MLLFRNFLRCYWLLFGLEIKKRSLCGFFEGQLRWFCYFRDDNFAGLNLIGPLKSDFSRRASFGDASGIRSHFIELIRTDWMILIVERTYGSTHTCLL